MVARYIAHELTGLKMEWNESSRIPSRNGTFTAYPLPRFIPTSCRSAPPAYYSSHSPQLTHPDVARTGEELSKPVETGRHDPIGRVKRLFHSVTVVHIHVNIKNSWMYPGRQLMIREKNGRADRNSSRMPRTLPIS